MNARRRTLYAPRQSRPLTPWWRHEVGGLPVWAMIVIVPVVAALVGYTVLNIPS